MPSLDEVRQNYPQYKDMPDEQLADSLHRKFYSDMPREQFDQKMGVSKPPATWGEAFKQAPGNIPHSAAEFGKSVVQPVLHPIDTMESFKNLGQGLLQKFGIIPGHAQEQYADAVGKFLKDRYGSMQAVRNTLAKDPVGLAADLSAVLTGGETLAARLPSYIGKTAEVVGQVGRAVDPLNAVTAPAKAAIGGAKQVAGRYLGHTGPRPLEEAFTAGKEGGQGAAEFQKHLRDQGAYEEVVKDAQKAVEAIGQERGKVYRSGMVDISKDYHMLDFGEINSAIDRHRDIGRYKGVDLETPLVKSTRDQMVKIIDEWKGYAPAQYHTPEGFDALKRKLGYVLDETERGSPARKVAGAIYDSVKDTIVKQAPAYAKVMQGYEEASDIIKQLNTELSLKPGANVGTAIRKLQSVMRNNVHAGYGHREKLAELIVENGADHLMQKLAGQALNTWTSRGLGAAVGSGDLVFGIGSALLGHPAALASVLFTLPMMSPRLLGETSYYLGKMSNIPGKQIAGGAFQAGRLGEAEQTKPQTPQPEVFKFDDKGNRAQQ